MPRLGSDRGADVVDREADRAGLERCQLRRPAEDVAVELLVDAHDARLVVDLRVDRVTATAEVDEVEQRERVLQLLARDREPRREVVCVEVGFPALAAGGEEMREQRLENTEPLGRDRPDGTLAAVAGSLDAALSRRRDALALVRVAQPGEPVRDGVEQGLRLERDGAPVLAQDPAGERLDPRERRLEDAVLERAGIGERSGDPPGRVVLYGDAGRADLVADLPRPRDTVRLDVELGREPEVALAPGREADVAADARDAEVRTAARSSNGELLYEPGMMDMMHGFRGDTLLVNGGIGPVARVPAGFVRLRLLNAANARTFDLRFGDRRSFFVIAGDAGYLAEPVEARNLLIAPAERYEVLVNFADGRPVELVTASDVGGSFGSGMQMGRSRSSRNETELLMQFQPDASLQATIAGLPRKLAALAAPDVKSAVAWRTFELNPMMDMGMMGMRGMGGQGGGPSQMMGINGRSFAMDRIDVTAKLGTSEVWEVVAAAMPMAHPFHVHGASFRILTKRGRKPSAHETGWKDVVLVQEHAELLVRFDNPAPPNMPFMYHCHVLEHEDHGMMGQFAVV